MIKRCLFLVLAILVLGACVTSVSGKELAREYYNLGNAYFQIKKYKEAIEFYQRSLDFDEYATKASFNMAYAYVALGNPDRATEIANGLLAKDPRNTSLLELIAYAYHVKGNDDEAIAHYLKILELQPDDKEANYNLAVIHWKKKEYDKAETYFRSLLKTSTGDPKALYGLGAMLLEKGSQKEAVGFLNQYLELKPEDVSAYMELAQAYTGLQQYLKALDTYEKAIAVDSSAKNAWFRRAELLLTKALDPDKGTTSLEQALYLGFNSMADIITLVQSVRSGPLLDHEKNKVYVVLKQRKLMPNLPEEKK